MRLARSLAIPALLLVGCSAGGGGVPDAAPTGSRERTRAPSGAASTSPRARPGQRQTPVAGIEVRAPLAAGGTVTATAPGTYRYRQSGALRVGSLTFSPDPEGTLEVAPPSGTASGARQRQARRFSANRSRDEVLEFRDDSVLLIETTTRFGPEEERCRTTEPLAIFHLPLRVGARWSGSSSCTGIAVSFSARVVQRDVRDVAGIGVETFHVHHSFSLTGDGYQQASDIDVWVAPAYRLVVRTIEHSEGTAQGAPYTDDLRDEIMSLAPER